MTATNHVLTGALIGLTFHSSPVLAIILALISHFALDALPHYGDENHTRKKFILVLSYDLLLASVILIALATFRPVYWQLALGCAVAAASPDLMWFPMWIREIRRMPARHKGTIMRFHKKIQWAEKAQNYPMELVWAAFCGLMLVKFV